MLHCNANTKLTLQAEIECVWLAALVKAEILDKENLSMFAGLWLGFFFVFFLFVLFVYSLIYCVSIFTPYNSDVGL